MENNFTKDEYVIAIMSAMEEENAALVREMIIHKEEVIGSRKYHCGELFGRSVIVVFSHWGKVAAAITASCLICRYNIDEIIFTGVAGAIDVNISVGDIVVANRLYQHDMDASPIISRHEIPLTGRIDIRSAECVMKKLAKSANLFIMEEYIHCGNRYRNSCNDTNIPRVLIGDIASGDQFIARSDQSQDIKKRLPNVSCVEMEGAAVAQVCNSYNTPFGIVRTISDLANGSSENSFNNFIMEYSQYYSLGIIRQYLKL